MTGRHPDSFTDMIVIPVAAVAARTGGLWTERSLIEDCRAGVIDHVNRKGNYGFTPAQLDALIARYTVTGAAAEPSEAQKQVDELEAARRHNASRSTRAGRKAA